MKAPWLAGSFVFALTTAFALDAAPVVSNVTMSQDESRQVTITYALDKPAVVTLDIETNVVGAAEWVSIGGENIGHLVGNANVYVKETSPSVVHTIYWQPCKSWPNHVITNNGARAVVRAWAPNAPPEWMLIDLTIKSNVHYYASMGSLPFGHPTNSTYKLNKLLLRKISAAGRSFRMGIPYGESIQQNKFEGGGDFITLYTRANPTLVSFTNDYYIGIYPITDQQYFNINGSYSGNYASSKKVSPYDECPVTGFSYNGVRGSVSQGINWPLTGHAVHSGSAMQKLRTLVGVDFDLPTNAQWEYACRAGEDRYRYDGHSLYSAPGLDDLCWYSGNSDSKMHPVGLKKPNAWGLYDMYGNGLEWVLDCHGDSYDATDVIEPTGPINDPGTTTPNRVMRSKQASNDARYMGSPYREKYQCNVSADVFGFRVVAPATAK